MTTLSITSLRNCLKILLPRQGYRAACRRHRSSAAPPPEGAEGAEERIKGIPTKEELRSQGSPLQDSLQRTGDYKQTDIKMLSQEEGEKIYILRYGVTGFKLQSGLRILGPMAVFPRSILHWNIQDCNDINEESLSLFTLLYPKPDILVLGIGDPGTKLSPDVFKYLRSKRLNVEILPTDMACATFNFLNSEHRYVVGGMIPPAEMLSDFDQSFMSMDQMLPDQPRLQEPPPVDDMTREQRYIKGNVIPRMFGREPTYEDPEIKAMEEMKEQYEAMEKQKQEAKEGNKLENKEIDKIEGERRDPDKG